MRREDFNNALNYIDYDLVEEYVAEKEQIQKRKMLSRSFVRFVPVAACLVLVITFSLTLLPMIINNQFGYSGEDVPSGEENLPESTTSSNEVISPLPPDDEGSEGVIPEGPGQDGGTSGEGVSPGVPSPDGPGYQEPGGVGKPDDLIFSFNFVYQSVLYELNFESQDTESFLQEREEKSLSADEVGEYITNVNVYSILSGEEISCPIYSSANGRGIIVELFEGLYFLAE